MPGIYIIQCLIEPRVYFGATTQRFSKRWKHHRSALHLNSHHNPRLQADYNLYGLEGFAFLEWESIEAIVPDRFVWTLEERERAWRIAFQVRRIRLYNPTIKPERYDHLFTIHPFFFEEWVSSQLS